MELFIFLLLIPFGIGAFGVVFYKISLIATWNKNLMRDLNPEMSTGRLSTNLEQSKTGVKKLTKIADA